ncbi:UDP-N-acetylglucosamine-peptide N-acetylglucosaminyltransferase, partial [Stenotrophomonas maltophilia]
MYRPAARLFVVGLAAFMAAPPCAPNHPRTDAPPPTGRVPPGVGPPPGTGFAAPPPKRAT